MKICELVSEINRLVERTPYSREEIAAIWKAESEGEWKPDVLFSYAAALEYCRTHGEGEKAKSIRADYERRLNDLMQFYSKCEPTPTS